MNVCQRLHQSTFFFLSDEYCDRAQDYVATMWPQYIDLNIATSPPQQLAAFRYIARGVN